MAKEFELDATQTANVQSAKVEGTVTRDQLLRRAADCRKSGLISAAKKLEAEAARRK